MYGLKALYNLSLTSLVARPFLVLGIALMLLSCNSALQVLEPKDIVGTWVSIDDYNYSMSFDHLHVTEHYKGTDDGDDVYNYEITNRSCDSTYYHLTKTDLDFLRKYNKEEEYCYELVNLSNELLVLRYTGNGRLLTFKKNEEAR